MMIGGLLVSLLGILVFLVTFVSSQVLGLVLVPVSLGLTAVGGVIWLLGALRHFEYLSNS